MQHLAGSDFIYMKTNSKQNQFSSKFVTTLIYIAIVIAFVSIVLEAYFSHTIKINLYRLLIYLCVLIPVSIFGLGFKLLLSYLYSKYLYKIDRKIF